MAKQAEQNESAEERRPFETVKALALAVLLALGIRSFVVEPFKIPSGSMIPTLLIGDYIIVNKFTYGVREPFKGKLLISGDEPKRGEVIVFRYPDDERIDYIKRVVGVPGDRLEIRRGRLWLNGQPVDRTAEGEFRYYDYQQRNEIVKQRYRELPDPGVEYTVIYDPRPGNTAQSILDQIERKDGGPWIVPEGHYFMMGDNRDNSRDSRFWRHRFVRADQIKGKAVRVHWSWVVGGDDGQERGFIRDFFHTLSRVLTFQVEKVRWGRIGRRVDGVADDGVAD